MDARALQRIRRKVEQGERLSPPELAQLRQAAQSDAGTRLKLTMAHALSNADADREALTLLSRLRREFPDEVQVLLGYARALVGLERYGEAEESLKRALTVSPGDPEALKCLAFISLRRGEMDRAHAYIDEVLKRDPVDDEARLLRAELTEAELPSEALASEQKALRPQFLEGLLVALEARQVHHVRQGKALWVKLEGGGLGRVDIPSLYNAYLEGGDALAQTVAAIAEELSQTADVPKTREALLARVRPVLRGSEFSTKAGGALHREGPVGLLVYYVLDDKDLVRYVPEAAARGLNASLAELDEAAWKGLNTHPAQPRTVIVDRGEPRLSPDALGLWALCEADGYDAARLLCPIQQGVLKGVVGEGPYRVALGRRELTLVCCARDLGAVALLDRLAPSSDGIPGRFMLHGGRLERLTE